MKEMYKLVLLLFLFAFTYSLTLAQSPQQFAYQAVVRDNNNNLVSNRTIGMRVSILRDSTNEQSAYTEIHTPKTNQQGIVHLNIGGGSVVSGSFASIPWSSGKLFVKTEFDILGGSNYSISGTKQLFSVPYALYSSDVPVRKSGDTITIGTSKLIIPGAQLLPTAAPASLSNGLLGYWPFNGNAKDESGNNMTATVVGAALTQDRYGSPSRAYSFDGNDYIKTSINSIKDSLTFSLWYKSNASIPGHPGLISSRFADGKLTGLLFIEELKNMLVFDMIGGNPTHRTQIQIDNPYDGKWHNIVSTYDKESVKIYFDGILKISQKIKLDVPIVAAPIYFGLDNLVGADNRYWRGQLDDIRIYNRALSQEEINYLANN